MEQKLKDIVENLQNQLKNIDGVKALEELKISFLGKKGELAQIMKELGALPKEDKPKFGQLINQTREFVENAIKEKLDEASKKGLQEKLKSEAIDVTMPGKTFALGNKHPMTIVIDEVKNIFLGMGYSIAEGPDIETDYYNFEALNMPEDHPSRDTQDTFYVDGEYVLRTQTSPVQVRIMEKGKLPIKVIAPGRVYRVDEVDATHSPVFHQLEGLVIDKNITMADLKGTLITFAKELFGDSVKTRLRPHHFRFTEPSAEMDVSCFVCDSDKPDESCSICKGEGWIEVLGCGMVHPKVLEMSGIDNKIYSGFAFGMGLDRLAMLRYGITDLRYMYQNDIRFLKQF